MKKSLIIFVSLWILLSLTACSEKNYDISKYDFDKLNNQEIDKVYLCTAEYIEYNNEDILNFYPELKGIDDSSELERIYAYELDDMQLTINETYLTYKENYLLYDTLFYKTFITDHNSPFYNKDVFFTNKNLNNFSIEEIKTQFYNYMNDIGVESNFDVKIYTLSQELLNSEKENISAKEKDKGYTNVADKHNIETIEKFTKEHECYYIEAFQSIEGISISPVSFGNSSNGNIAEGGSVVAIYNQSEQMYFNSSNMLDISNSKEETDFISIERAAELYEKKMSEIITTDIIEVQSIILKYYVEHTSKSNDILNVKPYWEIYYKVIQPNKIVYYDTINFDAITEKELLSDYIP